MGRALGREQLSFLRELEAQGRWPLDDGPGAGWQMDNGEKHTRKIAESLVRLGLVEKREEAGETVYRLSRSQSLTSPACRSTAS